MTNTKKECIPSLLDDDPEIELSEIEAWVLEHKDRIDDFHVLMQGFVTPDSFTVLAICYDRMDMLELLVELGANVNVADLYGGTALHFAIGSHREEMVHFLVKSGADIHQADHEGRNGLHFAIAEESKELVSLFIQQGADINVMPSTSPSKNLLELAKVEYECRDTSFLVFLEDILKAKEEHLLLESITQSVQPKKRTAGSKKTKLESAKRL